MGGIEVLFWIAIIVFSLLRGIQANKKRPPQSSPSPADPKGLDPLQEAIREIEAALRGEPLPSQQPPAPPKEVDPIPEIKSSRSSYEPEFHTMESSIPSRELESKSTFTESYSDKTLEKDTTYEDSFRKSTYYDDSFKHAHPVRVKQNEQAQPRQVRQEHPLKKRLKTKGGLAEAIVLQTILTRPTFPPDRNLR